MTTTLQTVSVPNHFVQIDNTFALGHESPKLPPWKANPFEPQKFRGNPGFPPRNSHSLLHILIGFLIRFFKFLE
jgi:hypothetical protein